MKSVVAVVVLSAFVLVVSSVPVLGQADLEQGGHARTVGVGVQASPFPAFGLGVTYNLNESLGLQAVGRMGIDVDFWMVRALYRFKSEPGYNVYANGFYGMFTDDKVYEYPLDDYETDTAPAYGLGVGYEHFFPSMARVGWNVEVDYIHIDFEEKWFKYEYETFNLVMLGLGVNYYF
jgi:hypothetical protein